MKLAGQRKRLGFLWLFSRARLREIGGDFAGAAELLLRANPPESLKSLSDAYRLRMLVLADEPKNGPDIMKAVKAFDWYQAPASIGDEFASNYCRYFEAGIRGDGDLKQHFRDKLDQLEVRRIYRHALRVT